jgi:hypothetical protein
MDPDLHQGEKLDPGPHPDPQQIKNFNLETRLDPHQGDNRIRIRVKVMRIHNTAGNTIIPGASAGRS